MTTSRIEYTYDATLPQPDPERGVRVRRRAEGSHRAQRRRRRRRPPRRARRTGGHRTVPTDRRVKLVVLTATGDRTRHEMIRTLYEPPPELLELDLEDLKALRDAVAKLPLSGA